MFALTVSCSCYNNKEEKVQEVLNKGLISSYKLISKQNQIVLGSLENKKWEPITAAKATIWYEKALAIKKSSDAMIWYIESLNTNIRDENKAVELYDSLKKYKEYVLNIDPLLKSEFYNSLNLVDSLIWGDETLQDDIYKPLLSSYQNNVAMAENKLLTFCHEQTSRNALICMQDMPIVFQNAKQVRPGDQIEITAGVGKFMPMIDQKITIGGMNVPLDDLYMAKFKIEAPTQIGKHTYPVRIEYKDQDGKLQVINKTVEFKVVK